MKLTAHYADCCLPDYWGGHHLAHISAPVDGRTTISELRAALLDELNQGAIAGNDERTQDHHPQFGQWLKAARAAVRRDIKMRAGKRRPFPDLDVATDYDDGPSAYCFVVFMEYRP